VFVIIKTLHKDGVNKFSLFMMTNQMTNDDHINHKEQNKMLVPKSQATQEEKKKYKKST